MANNADFFVYCWKCEKEKGDGEVLGSHACELVGSWERNGEKRDGREDSVWDRGVLVQREVEVEAQEAEDQEDEDREDQGQVEEAQGEDLEACEAIWDASSEDTAVGEEE